MSVIDIEKNKEISKIEKRKKKGLKPLTSKDKKYFSKIRTAVKKTK
jgi:hypothetical protein